MASVVGPEIYRARFEILIAVIESLKQLKARTSILLPLIKDPRIDLGSLVLVVDAWLAVLEDDHIRLGFEEDAETPSWDPTIHWITHEVLRRVQDPIAQLDRVLNNFEGLADAEAAIGELVKELDGVLATARTFTMTGLRGEAHKRKLAEATSLLREYETQKNLRSLVNDAAQAVRRTEESASKASEAAGATGESVMAAHYKTLADAEASAAWWFRLWTMVSTALAGTIAGVFLLGPTFGWTAIAIGQNDWVHLVQRAIVTAAVFAFAAYLARQAHQHRSMANWAGSLAVQLKTFEAFLDPISSEEVRDQLRLSFATRAFGDHPTIKGEPSGAGTSALTEKAIDLIAKNSGK